MRTVLGVLLSLCVALPVAADEKDDVKAAAKKLAEEGNYSWTHTPKGGGQGGRGQQGPSDWKTSKDGYTHYSRKMGEQTVEALIRQDKVAVKTQDGWKSGDELRGGDGQQRNPMGFIAGMLRNMKAPAVEAEDLLGKVGALKLSDDGSLSGDLTEEAAKEMLSRRGMRGGGGGGGGGGRGEAVADAKGTAKFWIKDGMLVKYEFTATGKVGEGDRQRESTRGATVEIKDVGSTKVEVPEEAKKLFFD